MMNFLLQPGFFRLGLAIMVVGSHMSGFEIGRPAVMAFFILSGYWVARMYHEKYACTPRPLTSFYSSRVLRIWPLYALCLMGVSAAMVAAGQLPASGIPHENLLLLGVASRDSDLLGVSWSLDIELQFYALLPLFLWALDLANSLARRIVLGMFAILLCVAGWYAQLTFNLWTVFSYLPMFLLGMFVLLLRKPPSLKLALGSLGAFAAVGLLVWMVPAWQGLLLKDVTTPVHEDWFGMAWVSLLLPFIAYNVAQKSSPLDLKLGNLSYPLYLIHWPVIAFCASAFADQPAVIWKPIAFLASMVLALVLLLSVDNYMEKWRRRIGKLLSQQDQGGQSVAAKVTV